MQTSTITGKWALTVVVLCCYSLAGTKAEDFQDRGNVSQIREYVKQNQHQYAANILAMDAELDSFQLNFAAELEIMQLQSKLLEASMQEVSQSIAMLQPMSDMIGNCVQKYQTQLATVASVKSDIAGCVASANGTFGNIATLANNTKNELKYYYNNNLTSVIDLCDKLYSNSALNYTICMTQAIAHADSVTTSYQRTFNAQMKRMTCDGDSLHLDCTYAVVYNTVLRIGEVSQKIDNCSQGNELRAANSKPCQRIFSWNGTSLDFFRTKSFKNPLYYKDSSVPCVLLKFKY